MPIQCRGKPPTTQWTLKILKAEKAYLLATPPWLRLRVQQPSPGTCQAEHSQSVKLAFFFQTKNKDYYNIQESNLLRIFKNHRFCCKNPYFVKPNGIVTLTLRAATLNNDIRTLRVFLWNFNFHFTFTFNPLVGLYAVAIKHMRNEYPLLWSAFYNAHQFKHSIFQLCTAMIICFIITNGFIRICIIIIIWKEEKEKWKLNIRRMRKHY